MKVRKPNSIEGYITYISPEIEVSNRGKIPYKKKMISIVTDDGQKFFGEVRKDKLVLLETVNISTKLLIHYLFEGSERDNKRYNNIYIEKLENI